ncbi:MAG TPA: hypothetical protein VGR43_10475, partial [Dehalococcoidia bacterium]|nr:hypothetical protein [Dehalococcoidia bacterium]
ARLCASVGFVQTLSKRQFLNDTACGGSGTSGWSIILAAARYPKNAAMEKTISAKAAMPCLLGNIGESVTSNLYFMADASSV